MKRVTGIGGVFFKSENPEELYQWYQKNLGIQRDAHGQGASFEWLELKDAAGNRPGAEASTAWSIFPSSTKYFGASKAGFMVNYRVDDLDALLKELEKQECRSTHTAKMPTTVASPGSQIQTETGSSCGSRPSRSDFGSHLNSSFRTRILAPRYEGGGDHSGCGAWHPHGSHARRH